ncbi:precorrin-2 C20-methyltransferase [Candidatus Magnetoovum chiemensis]|nr:precorrin-2 C20-methyltransferase [Candidatus Magnetoovum chiemensis]
MQRQTNKVNEKSNNTIYSIGLGPGEPDLITVKAKKMLEQSDIIIVPQSDKTGRSIAKDIVLNYAKLSKIEMYYFPMNNQKDELEERYLELAKKIVEMLKEGTIISYVTIGDPTIYSTSNYLTERLKGLGVNVIYIPGISSINAAATKIGIPLCVKGENFAVYELPNSVEETIKLINRHPTVVFLKVNKRLAQLIEALSIIKPSEAYLVRRVGLDGEEVYDMLKSAPAVDAAYLSVAIVKRLSSAVNALE